MIKYNKSKRNNNYYYYNNNNNNNNMIYYFLVLVKEGKIQPMHSAKCSLLCCILNNLRFNLDVSEDQRAA